VRHGDVLIRGLPFWSAAIGIAIALPMGVLAAATGVAIGRMLRIAAAAPHRADRR
jgi:hypothetical protein